MVRPADAAEAATIATIETWDDVLRAYAETIERQRAYLLSIGLLEHVDDALLVPPVFEVPADMPGLPASLEPWVISLLTETEGLTEIAHQILSDRPAASRPPRFAAVGGGSTLDQKI